MMGSVSESWTAERVAMLGDIKDRPFKFIVAAINGLPGAPLTRSAVIGKRDRLYGVRKPKLSPQEVMQRLLARREKDNSNRRQRRDRQKEKRPAKNGVPVGSQAFKIIHGIKGKQASLETPWMQSETASDDSGCLKLPFSALESGDRKCRWPFDASPEVEGSFVYCGLHSPEGAPYCIRHARLAYTVPQPRRSAA